jgi:hypothetical protein
LRGRPIERLDCRALGQMRAAMGDKTVVAFALSNFNDRSHV